MDKLLFTGLSVAFPLYIFFNKLIKLRKEEREKYVKSHVGHNKEVLKFVLTGGPCAGKTSALERLQGFLRERGFRVFIVPEAATMGWLNGVYFEDLASAACRKAFQQFVISTQIQLEDSFERFAKATGEKSVILCDRGTMDGSAYMDKRDFLQLLTELGLDEVIARDTRYNAVFHLVTAANGAEQFYTANQKTRNETPQEAIEQDVRTQAAWQGHPHHYIIDNKSSVSFDMKLQALVSKISKCVGLPSLYKDKSHKYSLKGLPNFNIITNVQQFLIEKVMLTCDGGIESCGDRKLIYRFLRKRTQGTMDAYGLTSVYQQTNGEQVELKQIINKSIYLALKQTKSDNTRIQIKQRRSYFLWENQSMCITEYLEPLSEYGKIFLKCQCEGEPVLPQWIQVEEKIAGELLRSTSSRILSLTNRANN